MYVKFDYTEDDLVDAAARFLSRSKSVRSARVRGAIYSVILSALVVYAALVFVNYNAAAFGAVGAALVIAFQQLTYNDNLRKRLRKIVREQHGQFGREVCEVELTPVGVSVRQCNTQVTYEWEVVEEVKETPESIDIYTRHGGGVIVRARAFRDTAERRRFSEAAEGYLELSRAKSAPGLRGTETGPGVLKGEQVGGGLEQGR